MDSVDLAILALRLVLVALLYAFLVIVLRLSSASLQIAAPRAPRPLPLRGNQLQLIVVDPGATSLAPGAVIGVPAGGVLGRAETCEVRLADPAVSAEHARISRAGRTWVVIDLGSTNGTRLNERAVSGETPLANGDVLALGNVRLKVVAR